MDYQVDITRKATDDGIVYLREQGMEVHESTPEELQQFRDATKNSFDIWAAKVGPEIVGSFQDSIAKAK